jgi:hypothetical protein
MTERKKDQAKITPNICLLDDGATLIEFITKKWRIGISLEKDLNESCWYFVTKKGESDSGYIFKKKEPANHK